MARKTSKKTSHMKSGRRWSANVQTASTYPPPGLFNQSAQTIARSLASEEVSPKGPVSGLRMLMFYINRAGKNLSKARRAELEKAKMLLSERIRSGKTKAKS